MGYPIFLGEIVVSETLTCNTVSKTVASTSGTPCYAYSATSGESLAYLFAVQIQAITNLGSFACTFSHTTGKYTFTNPAPSAATASISALSTTMQAILGLNTSTLSVAVGATVNSDNQVRGVWRPEKYPARRTVPAGEYGKLVSDSVTTVNRDRSTMTTAYEKGYEARYGFSNLPVQKIFPTSGYTNQDAKTFWDVVLRPGRRVRWVEDPDTSTTPLCTYYPLPETTAGHEFGLSDAPRLRLYEYDLALSTTSSGA